MFQIEPSKYKNAGAKTEFYMKYPLKVILGHSFCNQSQANRSYNIASLISEVSEEVATQIAKNCRRRQPHSHLRPPPRGTPTSIRIYFIFLETRVIGLHFRRCVYGSIFIQICAVGSKRRILSAPESTRVRFGRSWSSKVDDFGTNRKRVCDFLLVSHCDYGPILHRF